MSGNMQLKYLFSRHFFTYSMKMRVWQVPVFWQRLPVFVAQLDARPTGDQEVAGLTPAGLAIFFHGD